MKVIVGASGRGQMVMTISLYDEDEFSSVFRASLDSGVEVFFELDPGFEVWDVVRAASDSFREEFVLLDDGL